MYAWRHLLALIGYLVGAFDLALPVPNQTRGGWYTLTFDDSRVQVEHHDVLPDFPL
jgi:hypothetical protein